VRIDGRFQGSISSEGKLVLGKDAFVEGTIHVGELEVHGTLQGEILVAHRTLLHEAAKVSGSLGTALLAMEEGALLQGDLRMGKDIKIGAEVKPGHSLVPGERPVHILDALVKQ
jgi:cytoskeletal protein CcmA (bactofilin family)